MGLEKGLRVSSEAMAKGYRGGKPGGESGIPASAGGLDSWGLGG